MTDAARFSGLVVSLASWFLLVTACKSAPSESAPIHLLQQERSAFFSYLRDLGMDNDPDKVFTLTNGVLHITGQHYGYLATKQSYENYRLVAEFRWGEKTWPPRLTNACDKGTNAVPKWGKLVLQSEGAEIFFRRLDLYWLK